MVGTPADMVVVPLAAAVGVTRVSRKTEKMVMMNLGWSGRFFFELILERIINVRSISDKFNSLSKGAFVSE